MGRRRGASYCPDYSSREDEPQLKKVQEHKTAERLEDSHTNKKNRRSQVKRVDNAVSWRGPDIGVTVVAQKTLGAGNLEEQDHTMQATKLSSLSLNNSAPPYHPSLPWRSHNSSYISTQQHSDFQANGSRHESRRTEGPLSHIEWNHGRQDLDRQRPPGDFRSSHNSQSYDYDHGNSIRYVQTEQLRPGGVPQRSFGTSAVSNQKLSSNVPSRADYSWRPRPTQQPAGHSSGASLIRPSIEIENSLSNKPPKKKRPAPNSRSIRAPSPFVDPPPCPIPSPEYIRCSQQPQARRSTPQKLLVILDLNGTLLVRPDRSHPTKFTPRPGVNLLLEYLFSNHVVMIYSSARPPNVQTMLQTLLHPNQFKMLAAVWSRDKLGLTKAQYNAKIQVYKKLESVWADPKINLAGNWDQSNTVLVDDNITKGAAQPHNLVHIPEFAKPRSDMKGFARNQWHKDEQAILISLQERLEELKWQVDVSRLIREWHVGAEKAPGIVNESIAQTRDLEVKNTPTEQESTSPTSMSTDDDDDDDDNDSNGSVSPINEKVFQDLLGSMGATNSSKKS